MNIKFYCDIIGTYLGSNEDLGSPNRIGKIQQLISNIESLGENISFSFITSEKSEFLSQILNEFMPHLKNSNIKLGRQFSENSYFYDGQKKACSNSKSSQIIEDIGLSNENYDTIIYADDCSSMQKIVGLILEYKLPNIKLIQITPEEALKDLNETLEKMKKKKLQRIKK